MTNHLLHLLDGFAEEPSERAEFKVEMEKLGKISIGAAVPSQAAPELVRMSSTLAIVASPGVTVWAGGQVGLPATALVAVVIAQVVALVAIALIRRRT